MGKLKPEEAKTPLEIAEARIQDALKANAEELDLKYLGLTHLPESVSRLTQLRRLHFNGNKLTHVPPFISEAASADRPDHRMARP